MIQVADDALYDGNVPFQIQFTPASSDLAYGALPASLSPTLVTLDNEGLNASVGGDWASYD